MQEKNPLVASLEEHFVVGTDTPYRFKNRLCKLEDGSILFCLNGWAQMTIDLKKYEVVKNTQIVLLPNTVINFDGMSDDFSIFIFGFHRDMFREACMRLDTTFFRFLKENPCYTLPEEFTGSIRGLMAATMAIYADKENRFRNQIARNHLQSFLLDVYDKCYRFFTIQEIEGSRDRQTQLFERFITLVHENNPLQREVNFYADQLCISTKYLTGICRNVTGDSAKTIIDNFANLEIKVLLQSTDLSIQEIADKMRFPDQSYMGRYFKRHEGLSPIEYRNMYRKAENGEGG